MKNVNIERRYNDIIQRFFFPLFLGIVEKSNKVQKAEWRKNADNEKWSITKLDPAASTATFVFWKSLTFFK